MGTEAWPLFTKEMLYKSISALIALLAIAVAYKLLSRYITRLSRRPGVEPHVTNSLRLVLRVAAIAVSLFAVFALYGLPTSWFVGGSALIGAAIGLGSSQTIGNLVAGLYVIFSRPFTVKDYVRMGDVEGQVEEVSINYTRVYTPTYNLLNIPNIQVLTSKVLNCTHEGVIKYVFPVGFGHEVSNEDITRKCIEPAIEEFYAMNEKELPRKPEYYFDSSDRLGKSFKIRMFIPKGEARTLYRLQPELLNMIVTRWDRLRPSQTQT